jgi:serine/threonine-protein kinase HipA
VDALLFNWIIGGTDAHAKNYSFLLAPRLVRLAPLYDIASAYGVEGLAPQRMKLAMKIGGHDRLENIVLRHWETWARAAGLSDEAVVSRIRDMCTQLPDAVRAVSRRMNEDGLNHPIIDGLIGNLTKRAKRIGAM